MTETTTGPTAGDSDQRERPDLREELEDDPTHYGLERGEPWPADVPRGQDDTWYPYRDDPKAAKRAERRIAACWMLALFGGIGIAAVFVLGGQTQTEGILFFFAFAGLGAGFVLWARDLLPGQEITASRGHHYPSSDANRASVVDSLDRAIGPIARRPFLYRTLGLVGGVFGLAALFPLASLGPRPDRTLYNTSWGKGVRLINEDGKPVRPSDLPVNGVMTVFPASNPDDPQGSTMLLNVGDAHLEVKPHQQSWHVGGLVAYSKICTHAGCPVGLYNTKYHQLVCPCHQSTFNVLQDCKPVFGPASRPLPQLPLAVDPDGYLIAQGPYDQPVGPGFWNRG